ncbi:hypothetical protein ACFLW4_00765 [Chloroflexota bacterium]
MATTLQKEVDQRDDVLASADTVVAEYTGRPDARDNDIRTIETPQIIQLLEKQALYIIEAVAFSALCAEAFINYYVTRKKSAGFLGHYLDKLTPEQKWYLVPSLLNNGRSLEPGKEPLQGLKRLVMVRNRVVHAKPSLQKASGPFNLTEGRFGGPSLEEARKGVATVRALVKGLATIDPVVDTAWLDNTRPEVLFLNLENNGKWSAGL